MKFQTIQKLFFLFILLFFLFVFYEKLVGKMSFNKEFSVRVAFTAGTAITRFDPIRIQLDTEAVILDNLYSPLLRIGNDGNIVPFFAEKFWWKGDSLHLKVRNGYRTVDGHTVDVHDAEFSLRRVMSSHTNAHGDLALLICPDGKFENIDSPCPGLKVSGDELILTVVKSSYRSFLMKLLTTMDFGIIPRVSFDDSIPIPKIKDYRNTTGPYYVEKDDPNGAYLLKANPNHWLINSGMPTQLEFVPTFTSAALDLLEAGKVDFISCINVEPSAKLMEFRNDVRFNFFDTYPIRKYFAATTQDQLSKYSKIERHAIYQKIREAFLKHPDAKGWNPSIDFYPALGEGSLDKNQLEQMQLIANNSTMTKTSQSITIRVGKRWNKMYEEVFKDNSEFKIVQASTLSPFLPLKDRPDFYITGTDSAFQESFSLISYNITADMVLLTKEESKPWLNKYISLEDKEERIKMLRELNFKTLESGLIGVIGEAPYTSVSRKPFRYEGSKFFAGSPLWVIRQN